MDPWLAVLFELQKRNLVSGAPSEAEHGQRLSPRYIAMENITSSFPALIVQVSCEPWHTRRRPIRSWLGGTDLENLLSWLAKRVAGGTIELSRWFQDLFKAKSETIAPVLPQAAALAYHQSGGASSPPRSNALSQPISWTTPVWGICPAPGRKPR